MGLEDALVGGVVSFVVQQLGDFVVGRSLEFFEIRDDIDWIKRELEMMKAYLRDADRRVETCQTFDIWEQRVKDAAYKIEDFLDDYVFKESKWTIGASTSTSMDFLDDLDDLDDYVFKESKWTIGASTSTSMGWIADKIQGIKKDVAADLNMVYFKSWVANEIQGIKKDVAAVSMWGESYIFRCPTKVGGFVWPTPDTSESSGRVGHHVQLQSFSYDEMDIVGIDEDVNKLMGWLLSEKKTGQHPIMSIVGMGGSGKTTLAKRVYDRAKNHFDYHLWVTVSHYSKPHEINYIFNSSKKKKSRSNFETIDLLRERRYVLFLDDIKDIEFWNFIKNGLPRNGMGRIIFTCRQTITDPLIDEICEIHTMTPLTYESARDLFCRKAFRNDSLQGKCPCYLNKWCDEIVRRCGGLPLALVTFGGLLGKKDNSERRWKEVVDRFGPELVSNRSLESLTRILQASYNDLPSYLKYCFLYACLFPKQYEIKRAALIRMWVAQRFIEKQPRRTLEEVANYYFVELTERCLFQPIISDFTGELKACMVPSIMHDFAIEKFSKEFGAINEEPCNGCEQKRYLAIHNSTFSIPCEKQHSSARSLLSFGFDRDNSKCLTISKILPLRFLKVLCLEGLTLDELPEAVGDLFHLAYLGLRKSRISKIPTSLKRLSKLETFDIRDASIEHMAAIEFGNFRNLRHLLLQNMKVYSSSKLLEMPFKISNLTLLQTLLGVIFSTNIPIRGLPFLKQLRKLYVRMIGTENMRDLFTSIGQIDKLCSLKIECCDNNGKFTEFTFDNALPLPLDLEKLVVGGVIMELPQWFGKLKSLRVLVLVNSMLVYDPLRNLAQLPCLISLKLIHAYNGEQMGFGPEGFPKLRHLHIASIDFEEWTRIEEGSMPCIQVLSIIDCCKLKMLPEGFEHLKSLRTLEVIEMPDEFIERLMTEDKSKVEFIANITPNMRAATSANVYGCFVGGLALTANNSSLQHAFSPYGEILDSFIIKWSSESIGYVLFANEQSMRNAIEELNGKKVDKKTIIVRELSSEEWRLFQQRKLRETGG